jgi:hypothetical protein
MTDRTQKRRYSRLMLAVFVALAVLAIGCTGWLAGRVRKARDEARFVDIFEKWGRPVVYLDEEGNVLNDLPGPSWLRRLLGENFFVVGRRLRGPFEGPEILVVTRFSELKHLSLARCEILENSDLRCLRALRQLEGLSLDETSVTNEGLTHLKGLSAMRNLMLNKTSVSDAGLRSLRSMTRLESLWLQDTLVTDEGVEWLASTLSQLEMLDLTGTKVTDRGVKSLTRLLHLESLSLDTTLVTDEGVAHLTALADLRHLRLTDTGVTDASVKHITQMSGLEYVSVLDTHVTLEGAKRCQASLPEAHVIYRGLE